MCCHHSFLAVLGQEQGAALECLGSPHCQLLPTGDSSWCIWWVQVGSTHGHSFACPVQVPSIPSVPAQSCPEPPLPMERPKDVTKGRQDTEGQASVLLGLPAGRFSWER